MKFRHTKTVILITLLLLLALHAQGLVTPGRITVYSTPSGALACIDNVDCDTTGATFTAGGNSWHTVVITERGYLQWSDSVYVTSDQTAVVNAVLEPNPSTTGIQVYVTPGSGTVCLDNSQCRVNVGTAGSTGSTQFAGLSQGYHTVTVDSTDGYQDYSTQAYVSMGSFTTLRIELDPSATPITPATPATGTVRVYIDRVGSTVCIDNGECHEDVGGSDGPGTGTTIFSKVTADSWHSISVAADGYKPYSTQVSVSRDQINTVDVSLEPLVDGTTLPTPAPTPLPTGPTPQPTRAGLDALPVLGALVVCGAVIVFRNDRQ
jgi:hypothetical protein